MATCLIFGLTSFTGQYVKTQFEQNGYDVIGTTFSRTGACEQTDPRIIPVDILDGDAVARVIQTVKPDIVIHLSGISFVINKDPSQFYLVHVFGVRNILTAIVQHAPNVSMVVLASTGQVYGKAPYPDEQTPVCPLNDYAITKSLMEKLADLWSNRLPIICARPFNCIGVGQAGRFAVSKIHHSFMTKQTEIELGDTSIARDFVDIRRAAHAYYLMATKGTGGDVYNIASGLSHTLDEIIDLFTHISGHTVTVRENPDFIRADDPVTIRGSIQKISALSDTLFAPTLKETLTWMVTHANRH